MSKKIPIVFAFDDNYALPASIAIKSLWDNKKGDTEYDVFVLYSSLKKETIEKFNGISPINWIQVDKSFFKDAPINNIWSDVVYYRLLIQDLIPQYDKIIWSDVDVLFQGDLSNIYDTNLDDYYWAGVIAERQDEPNGIHAKFSENKNPYIHMSGFMVINAQKMRQDNMKAKFFETIKIFGSRLKFFDLDVLNLACDKIKSVPFEYCVLENIFDAEDIKKTKDYGWLCGFYSEQELQKAKKNPTIIHYAGQRIKIWNREYSKIPPYYWEYIKFSPFYNHNKYFPNLITRLKLLLVHILYKSVLYQPWRKVLKQKYYKMKWQ